MGIQDFVLLFDHLDVAQQGFVTVDQLVPLLESVYLTPVAYHHVDAAILQVCGEGHSGKVNRHAFLAVLEEISRRQSLEEQAYWDFQALDSNGSNQIKLRDALVLFQEYHGDAFSLFTWHAFLQSRLNQSADVHFDEIRIWLCGLPSGQPANDKDVQEELSRIEQSHWDQFSQDYDALKLLKEGEDEDDDQRSDDTRRHAHRKLQKWNHHGVGAMLQDDGLDSDEEDAVKPSSRRQDAVSAADLLDAMETKYSLLMEALMAHMAAFAANMDSEKPELIQQIRRSVNKMMKDGKMGNIELVPGSWAMLPLTLQGMMGPLPLGHQDQLAQMDSLRQRLIADGKSASEIDSILKKEHHSSMDGPLDCGQALSDLLQRRVAEKEWLLAVSRGQAARNSAPWSELCRLQRQIAVLKEEVHPIVLVAIAVGLAERLQKYHHHMYDPDRENSEHLAKERLQKRQGHALVQTTSQLPDIALMQTSGGVHMRAKVVEEAELRYHLEREALVFMLQGPGSAQKRAAGLKMSGEERRRRLTTLRSHHLNWKMGSSGDSTQNFTILEEAVGLYWAGRHAELEKHQHNVNDTRVSTAVLADLQQKQEVDFAQCLTTMEGKGGENLITLLKQESRARLQEHFSNVAFVVLGAVDLTQEDQEYLDALAEKYRAIRDQIFVFALKDKHGHAGWNSLGREGRQGELLKLRKEEKKLRGDGRLVDMAKLIGPKSQALPALIHLVGENKVYGKRFGSDPSATKSINLVADLVSRFDLEQEAVLSWLHSEETQMREGSRQKLRELASVELERFGVGMEGDYEAGLIALGLLERIEDVSAGRSKADKEKQQQLAEKRVALRKWRVRQGEPCKVPAEDKVAPTPGDRLSWQRAVVRSVQRRHAVEQEVLLRVLQDAGFTDLVEAAALMAVEQRWQRQAQLALKHAALNFASPEGQEDLVNILEEAAALRVVGVRARARQKTGKALSEDEVSATLLLELQDLHDRELFDWLHNGLDVTEESALQLKLDSEKKSRKEEHAGSVMTVFTRVDGDLEITDVFLKILEEKYGALHEALLRSAVLVRGGQRQSQKQRDKQLQALRKELAPLWEAGDAEQIAQALGSDLSFEHPVAWLLGVERSKFARDRESVEGQNISEAAKPEDAGVQAAVRHLMQRFAEEKDHLLSSLAGASGQFLSENAKLALKSRLKRENIVTAAEDVLMFAALACGLVERQPENISAPQLEKDRERYYLLGKQEFTIRQAGREGGQKKETLTVERKEDRELLQDAVLHLLWKKHLEERQLLVEMLGNPRFDLTQKEAALESDQQRNDRLSVLKSKCQASNLESRSDSLTLLQEALVVFREIRRDQQGQGSTSADDLHLNSEIMAALLLLQNAEAEQYLSDFATEEPAELIESQEQILEELRKNQCINIAALVFSSHMFQQDGEKADPLVKALDGKYDALRDKLLMQSLIDQMGETNWRNLSERERQRRVLELKLKQRQLQRDGKLDESAALLGDAVNNEAMRKKLLGDSREEYERKLAERLAKRKQRLSEGLSAEECDRLEKEEEEQEEEEARQRRRNILQDLEHNYDQERDALLRQLQEGKGDGERERQKRLLQLKLEEQRLRRDDDVHTTALLLDQHGQLGRNKEAERQRQEQVARERLEAARLGRKEGQRQDNGDAQLAVIASNADTENDPLKLQEMALNALDLKHLSERQLLIDLLEKTLTGDQRDRTRDLSTEKLATCVQEVGDVIWLRKDSPQSSQGVTDEQSLQLLGEALCYTLELKKRQLDGEGKKSSDTEVQVALLADLQQLQDTESAHTLESAIDMDEERLRQLTHSIMKKKEQGCHDNVVHVILEPGSSETEGSGGEDGKEEEEGLTAEEKEERKVVKALEMKYDALRDKLVIEALMQQYGEAEWKRLSELERQRKIAELKRKERQLRHEGKMDEIEMLLGQHLKHKETLDWIVGDSQQDQRRGLEERLARRRQLKAEREAEGLAADEDTLDDLQHQEEQQQDGDRRKKVLENLQKHFEDEKAALLAALNRHSDGAKREKERQNALVKLHRERKRLQQEDKLDSAVLIFNMAMQQHGDQQESLLKEHDRQRQLSRERLMHRRQQILEGKEAPSGEDKLLPISEEDTPENPLVQDDGQLKEAVLMAFDRQQMAERDTLQQLLTRCRPDRDSTKHMSTMSDEELRLKMTRAEKEHSTWRKESARKVMELEDPQLPAKRRNKLTQKAVKRWQAQLDILAQAMAHKLQLEHRQLAKLCSDRKEEEVWEELCVITLTSLQERQMALFNTVQDSVLAKNKEELETMRKAQRAANREGWFDSLSAVAFSVEDMTGEVHSLSDRRAAESKLQEEFLQQKQALLEKAQREGLDANAMLKNLEEQFAAKKKGLREDMERQRSEVLQRLEARRQHQADRSFESDSVIQMLKQAETQSQAAQDRASTEQGNQRSLLQERLQQRREARRHAALTSRQKMESPMSGSDGIHRSDSVSTIGSMGLRREKTVIEATVSDDQKQAIYNQLVKQQLNEQFSKTSQRQRQEEELKLRLEARKGKRKTEVAALFSLGERQKTFLEQAKKGEQDRQIAQMRDRVERVKSERTRKSSSPLPEGKGFAEQALEEKDEDMYIKASQLQQQFQTQAQQAKAEQPSPSKESGQASLMTEKSRMDSLKERRKQKKQQKQ